MKVKDQLKICTRYITKQKNAVESGVLFALPLVSFINIMKAKRCSITGHSIQNSGGHWAWNYTTIDRVDRARGYEKGNCIAVAQRVNEWTYYTHNQLKRLLGAFKRLIWASQTNNKNK